MSDLPVTYHVDLDRHVQHLVEVTVTVPGDVSPGARLVMATWTPGSYTIRDYAHWVQSVRALAEGDTVEVRPDGHTAWRLPDDVVGDVTVTFELYANQLTVRTNHVDDVHALLIPAATFPYVEGTCDRVHEVTVQAPEGWAVWGMLPHRDENGDADDDPDATRTWVAPNYDRLIDSAFEAGHHNSVEFAVADTPHRFVWAGHGGDPDLGRIGGDAAKLGEAAVALMGELPTEDYTFVCVGWDAASGGGGLEHRDGSVLQMPVRTFQDEDRYARFLSLVAHEYLHLWNVKRMTPTALVQPDYVNPTHTTSLWVAEGWTAYYDELLPHRAGLWSTRRFLDAVRDTWQRVLDTPGRHLQSVQDASHDAWTKFYVADENRPNVTTSYYDHGATLALCLDLLLRRDAPEGDGLDEVFRLLWQRFGGDEQPGYTEADVVAAVNECAGRDLSDFFADHVVGTDDPPVAELLDIVGLATAGPAADAPATPHLGVRTTESDNGVTFASVLRGGPAWTGGLTGGDHLLAINGQRVGRGELATALRAHRGGSTVHVAVFRGPRLLVLPITLDEPQLTPRFVSVSDPSDRQRAVFARWSGRELPSPETS